MGAGWTSGDPRGVAPARSWPPKRRSTPSPRVLCWGGCCAAGWVLLNAFAVAAVLALMAAVFWLGDAYLPVGRGRPAPARARSAG